MHRLVFERRVEGLRPLHRRTILVELCLLERAHDGFIRARPEREHFVARRPFRFRTAPRHRGIYAVGIDSAFEELFQPRINRCAAKPSPQKREDAEGGQVSFVEDDRITQRDRPRIVRGRIDEVKNRAGTRPVAAIPVDHGGPIDGEGPHQASIWRIAGVHRAL